MALSFCWTIWSSENRIFKSFRTHKATIFSYLLYHLLLFNGAHCTLQEVNHCCLIFRWVLSQMLNMCRPSKPAKRYFLYLRLKIYNITWLLKIWLPPFCVFRAPHFRGIFVVGSSRSWSRGRAPPPPCEAGSGLDQSGLTRHPADLIA